VAEPKQQKGGKDRRGDVEALAATIYAARLVGSSGKTPESVAADALAAAREFYRVCDSRPES
jgi:hypothetical protein